MKFTKWTWNMVLYHKAHYQRFLGVQKPTWRFPGQVHPSGLPNLLGSLFSMSFIGSLFCLWPINFCIPFWTYFGSHSISSHFLAQSFLLTNFQYKYLCYNISSWKNPQALQNWTDLIRKIVSAVCPKPMQLCNLSANRKSKWSQGLD